METNTGSSTPATVEEVKNPTAEEIQVGRIEDAARRRATEELERDARDGRQLFSILARHLGERGYEDATPEGVLNRIISERDELAKAYAVITGDVMQTTQEELDAARATIARLQPRA